MEDTMYHPLHDEAAIIQMTVLAQELEAVETIFNFLHDHPQSIDTFLIGASISLRHCFLM